VYLLGDEGYAVVGPDVPDAPHWTLEVYDHCAPTAATMRTLLAFLAGHRSLVDTVRWQGQPGDPLLALIAEADWSVAKLRRWMLRVVDVRAALVARGWSSDGEIRLAVNDAIFPENNGPWHLRVRDGEARVEPCTSADLALPVRAMAPLYSGYLSASRLAGLGWAEGSPEPLAAADRLFAGPTPFMREMY
jgi:predicted acetyltransferase